MLLGEGADPNTQYCGLYHQALHAAATGGDLETVRLLLEASADIKAQGSKYSTALHLAAKQGNPEVV